jgi:SP family general alpha glucoside:H+ symporter-like MFS transporter
MVFDFLKRSWASPGRSDAEFEQESGTSAAYDVALAEAAEKKEKDMTFKEARKADKRLIWYSLGFSGTIIMEGYGLALITYLFSFAVFKTKYGKLEEGTEEYEVRHANQEHKLGLLTNVTKLPYEWRVFLPLVAQFGSLIGILIASPLATRMGYRRAMLYMLLLSLGFVFIPFFANSVSILMVGFLFQGIPWGVFQVISPAYASEVASLQLRPILTTWNNLCWVIGQFLASGITKGFESSKHGEMSYRVPFAFQWIFSAILLVAVAAAPESPYWYLQKGRVEEARRAVKKLVRKGDPLRTEMKLALMRHTIHQEAKQNDALLAAMPKRIAGSWAAWFGKFEMDCFKGVDRRRTETASMAWLVQAMCGSSLIPWAPKLFEAAGLQASDALSINIALPAAGIVGTLASWWLMRKAGRRQIYLWGLLAMGILLAACGAFHYLPSGAGWAAGGTLILYTAVYDLTIGPVCYSVVSELPSIRLRTATLSVARGCYLVAGVLNHVLTPKMLGREDGSWDWGARSGFLYAILCAFGALYTYFRIPETGGMSARELDILFQNKVSARKFSSEQATLLTPIEEKVVPDSSSDSSKRKVLKPMPPGLQKQESTITERTRESNSSEDIEIEHVQRPLN